MIGPGHGRAEIVAPGEEVPHPGRQTEDHCRTGASGQTAISSVSSALSKN